VNEQDEIKGMDSVKHGGGAYENPLRRLSQWSSRGKKDRPIVTANANVIPEESQSESAA